MTGDGWDVVERLQALVVKAQADGVDAVRLDRLGAWLERAVVTGSGVARPVAPEPTRVLMDPVDVRTAAALLGVSPQRVRALCADGKLTAVRTSSGTWTISRTDVMERRNRNAEDQGKRKAA